jgi:hypothetical protein
MDIIWDLNLINFLFNFVEYVIDVMLHKNNIYIYL